MVTAELPCTIVIIREDMINTLTSIIINTVYFYEHA